MTTLEAIGYTVAAGAIVFFVSLLAFGLALKRQSVHIAPRCAARPRNVIYNPDPHHSSQYHGSALLGWVMWSLGLTYDEMLKGIPGTGTRKGGLEGSMLRANMDGIVLLRFHSVCYKITKVATFVCLAFILPMNLTGMCYEDQQQGGDVYPGCPESYNLTNYDRTTLANIPALTTEEDDALSTWGVNFGSLLGRMYGIAVITWVITFYACYILRQEWIELLAMRRVYYLENDVWGERKEELQATLLRDDDSDEESPSPRNRLSLAKKPGEIVNRLRKEKKVDPTTRRDPWIPHPEQRDTVPNVSLYSVLVGNLPALPQQAIMSEQDVENDGGQLETSSIDWQLALTTRLFDECIPNQPGFSSSVAAVTILPSASKMGKAWAKWYTAAGKLRRLRYIRSLISDLRHYEIQVDGSDDEHELPQRTSRSDEVSQRNPSSRSSDRSRSIYRNSVRNQNYFREVLGSENDEEVEANFLLSFNFGPEQFAVYSREFAQSAAACCPNGCGERRLRRARIDELLIMEQEAIAEVHAANAALEIAQNEVNAHDTNTISPRPSKVASPVHSPLHSPVHSQTDLKKMDLTTGESYEAEAALMSRMPASGSALLGTTFASNALATRARQDVPAETSSASNREQSSQWNLVQSIVEAAGQQGSGTRSVTRSAITGQWKIPTTLNLFGWIKKQFQVWRDSAAHNTSKVVDAVARDSTYAIVTFTSRQAAVAARHCLADGRAVGRWTSADEIPVPPLSDAAPFAICPCRGCCRPVTISINDRQKAVRRYMAITILAAIYVFYTIPLTFATSLVDPVKWEGVFPALSERVQKSAFYSTYLSSFIPALIWTGFFALCPVMFKFIANFGSNASSVVGAEYSALQYYWWFMVFTAFTGQSLATMVLNGFSAGNLQFEVQEVLAQVASAIPTQISAQWLNWIIVRIGVTLPLHYMLQVNTFLFSCLGWKCCSRLVRGGGPGGPVPYRIYVDAGVVLLCVVALAPASPMIAPFALIHYLYSEPVLRRNLIFVYRPRFDGGGVRWPFLFDVIISSLLVAHILMVAMLVLKQALGPALVAFVPFLPTVLFRYEIRNQFVRSYFDAALLQTSMLDGWDVHQPTSMKKREEFRKFLVDSHKAAYVPVCIAGRDDVMTAEPAVVISHDNDEGHPSTFELRDGLQDASARSDGSPQYGVAMRRVTSKALERSRATLNSSDNEGGSGTGSRNFSFSALDNINEEHVSFIQQRADGG